MSKQHETKITDSMRIDKWLWAARFFKTRSIAKAAIEGGKVHHNNDRVKVSREVRVGMELTIQQGFEKKTVIVKALSSVRGGAPTAQLLYEETEVSIARRELLSAQRKLHNLARPDHRPSKKDRRDITRFRQQNGQQYDEVWSYDDE
ncbi:MULTISPECIES: RNA-binding S4 domain-containing protein [unclassified Acinetobacter]|uniref:RNA-binding S4 domain-containing protein n=1 Tax=unclassified Acinetobacter TaxID=196816 RepID=UPI0004500DD8|nr:MULTISPECIES: S4 domain-containing protein [unclassified Acinetobacter]EZQ12423.1 tRNA synthetase RNA-binding protein [Acinetobacter sp. Ver3]SEL43141.1 heat shock protein Hsp15 [Acinetobacter sp. DSM 11652]